MRSVHTAVRATLHSLMSTKQPPDGMLMGRCNPLLLPLLLWACTSPQHLTSRFPATLLPCSLLGQGARFLLQW
jgi:hypothetical protein